MKLISEHVDAPVKLITEKTDEGKTHHFIEGVFMQAEKKNRNGRVYPKSILKSAVDKYISEQVSKGRAVGELDHPEGPQINLDKVSHRITELYWDGNDVVGKALVLNTRCGRDLAAMLEGGVQLGVSSRGMGSLSQRNEAAYVGEDFVLNTVDVVQDPSAHEAFVNGIMEGVDWFKNDEGIYVAKNVKESLETELKEFSTEERLLVFKKFLSNL